MHRLTATVFLILLCHSASAEPSPAGFTPSPDPPRREIARQWFSTAVSLARAGRYASAKALFLEAYAAEPHYVVLYNIAQADLQLGELTSAASFLRRFLAEAGAAISPEQRQAVAGEIKRIEGLRALPAEVEASALRDAGLGNVTAETRAHAGAATFPVSASTAPPVRAGAALTARGTLGRQGARGREAPGGNTARIWGYGLATGGFAVLGGAVGLYAWNHERYNRWQAERDALLASTEQGVSVENEAVVNARVRENNARLAAIKGFDAVPLITAGLGIAAMGAGLWTLIHTREGARLELSSSPSELELRVHSVW